MTQARERERERENVTEHVFVTYENYIETFELTEEFFASAPSDGVISVSGNT
jgi:hypothetical protein